MQCKFVLPHLNEVGFSCCMLDDGHIGGHLKHGQKESKKDEQKRWYERTHCGECGRPVEQYDGS
jgi:hypothetical protein